MAFWSSEKIKQIAGSSQLITPFNPDCVQHAAYEMSMGCQAYITSAEERISLEDKKSQIVIPPGQFALLLTEETVSIPKNAIGFISIRANFKFKGLVNVSGFHVDPGYSGKLMFSVFNAGSSKIYVSKGDKIFLVWFSDLDQPTSDEYKKSGKQEITSEDIMKIQGDVASPSVLKGRIDNIERQIGLAKAFALPLIIATLTWFFGFAFGDPIKKTIGELFGAKAKVESSVTEQNKTADPTTAKPQEPKNK